MLHDTKKNVLHFNVFRVVTISKSPLYCQEYLKKHHVSSRLLLLLIVPLL